MTNDAASTSASLISVIIPVYNAERYLQRCIESLVTQTMTQWEAIFVNDGSSDNSAKILDDFASSDTRVKVIHKENGGVSTARNIGLSKATTPFVTMLDADDFFAPSLLQKLYETITQYNCEVACCNMRKIYPNGTHEDETPTFTNGMHPATPANIYAFYMRSPWAKIYRRDIIKHYNINFPEGITICEDDVFVMSYWSHISHFAMINEPLYNYLQSDTSVLRRLGEGKLSYEAYEKTLDVPILVYRHLCEHSSDSSLIRQWCIYLIKHYFHLSLWMQECCQHPKYVVSLKKYERKNAKVFAHLSPFVRFLIHLRIYSGRKIKTFFKKLIKRK